MPPHPSTDSFPHPDALRLPRGAGTDLADPKPKRPDRFIRGEPFLRGPVPWRWVERAAALPGRALFVALVLWREAGCTKSRTVTLSVARATAPGFHRATVHRGLRRLEAAGLVRVRSAPGRCFTVDILDAPATDLGPAEAGR
jgi:hypothetical protein